MKCGALRALRLLRPEGRAEGNADRYPNSEPHAHVSCHCSKDRTQRGSHRNSPSCELPLAIHNLLQLRLAVLGGTAESGRPYTSSPDPSLRFRQLRLWRFVADLPNLAEQF
jgi:hypothetical protein